MILSHGSNSSEKLGGVIEEADFLMDFLNCFSDLHLQLGCEYAVSTVGWKLKSGEEIIELFP